MLLIFPLEVEVVITCELAQSKRPPMGANIIPTMKNRGRTVFGVRIGLRRNSNQLHSVGCIGGNWKQRTARPSIAVAETQYLYNEVSSALVHSIIPSSLLLC